MESEGKKNADGTYEVTLRFSEDQLKRFVEQDDKALEDEDLDSDGTDTGGMELQFIRLRRRKYCVSCRFEGKVHKQEEFRATGDIAAQIKGAFICGFPPIDGFSVKRGRCD